MNASADGDAETLRISTDTEATVSIGEYSGHGSSRGLRPVRAWDRDMRMKEKLIPGGIPEPVSGRAFLFFTGSCETGDFMADGFFLRRNGRRHELSDVRRPVINTDNGPGCSGRRTQFLPRLTESADATGLIIRLITAGITQSDVTGRDLKNHGTDIFLIQQKPCRTEPPILFGKD